MASKKKGGKKAAAGAKKGGDGPTASEIASQITLKQWKTEVFKKEKFKQAADLAKHLKECNKKWKYGKPGAGASAAASSAAGAPAKTRPSKKGGLGAAAGKVTYQFGSARLNLNIPEDYAKIKAAEPKLPTAGLELAYAHGYSGNFDESRQNVYLTPDGKLLIYYIAAVVVVMNVNTGKQSFFTHHNDDITTVALRPGAGNDKGAFLVASGQKDPKDEPGQGKDLPKIYVWRTGKMLNPKSKKKYEALIDDVCWGKIARLQFSNPDRSDMLYCICGDADQTLKGWHVTKQILAKKDKDLDKARIVCNTMRELILGFVIRDDPEDGNVDEFLLYGKRKFGYCTITGDPKKLSAKIKSVSTVSLKKDGEKSFASGQFLPGTDGKYAVGSQSGAIYIGKANTGLFIYSIFHCASNQRKIA